MRSTMALTAMLAFSSTAHAAETHHDCVTLTAGPSATGVFRMSSDSGGPKYATTGMNVGGGYESCGSGVFMAGIGSNYWHAFPASGETGYDMASFDVIVGLHTTGKRFQV